MSFSSFPKATNGFYGAGPGGGAHGDINILDFLTARLSVDYLNFSSGKDKLIAAYVAANPGTRAGDFTFDGLGIGIFSVYASGLGKIPSGSPVTPYGLVGLGINFISTSEGKVTYQNTPQPQANIASNSETKFGLNFGAGAEFSVPFGTIIAEVKYVLVFTNDENSSYIPIVVGATFGI